MTSQPQAEKIARELITNTTPQQCKESIQIITRLIQKAAEADKAQKDIQAVTAVVHLIIQT